MKTIPIAKCLIVDSAGNVLILKRSPTHPTMAGQVDLPGGQIDAGEEPGEALIREILEETGLRVAPSQLTMTYAGTQLSGDELRVRVWYIVRLSEEKPAVTISWEHQSFTWLPASDLPGIVEEFRGFYRDALAHVLQYDLLKTS